MKEPRSYFNYFGRLLSRLEKTCYPYSNKLTPFSKEQHALGEFFCFLATGIHYNQPLISVEEQIATLKNEGLVFMNEDKAKHLLNHINLFRVKSYLHPKDWRAKF